MKKHLLFLLSLLACAVVFAQGAAPAADADGYELAPAASNDWHLSLGVSYRKFRKPKFRVSGGSDFDEMLSLNGSLVEANNANLARAVEARYGAGVASTAGVRRLTFATGSTVTNGRSSGSYSVEESLAPTVGALLNLWTDGNIDVSFVANLSYFQVDSASRGYKGSAGDASVNAYDRMVGWDGSGNFKVNDGRTMAASENVSANGLGGAVGKTKLDLDLLVIDAGLSVGFNFDFGLRAYLAAGPTFTYADMESSCRGVGHSNHKEINWGLYVSGGADFWFNETVGLAAELRYDEGFGDVSTRYAKQDLDAFGGSLKLLMRF